MAAALALYDERGWFQVQIRRLGSYAQSSTPAYILSGIFAVSTPLGFASNAQLAAEAALRSQRKQLLAQASKAVRLPDGSIPKPGLMTRLAAANHVNKTTRNLPSLARPVAPFWQLAFLSAAFATGGYIIDQGDVLNGSGIVTAWSLSYLLLRTIPTFGKLSRNPAALGLTIAVSTLGLGVHGSHYFDKTSWRGAVPMFTDYDSSSIRKSNPIFSSQHSVTPSPKIDAPRQTNNNDSARAAAYLRRQSSTTQRT